MKKHNRKFVTRWGSAAVDKAVPQLAHKVVNNKGFQLAANPLLCRLLGIRSKQGVPHG